MNRACNFILALVASVAVTAFAASTAEVRSLRTVFASRRHRIQRKCTLAT
jgi:hypothetical protein